MGLVCLPHKFIVLKMFHSTYFPDDFFSGGGVGGGGGWRGVTCDKLASHTGGVAILLIYGCFMLVRLNNLKTSETCFSS